MTGSSTSKILLLFVQEDHLLRFVPYPHRQTVLYLWHSCYHPKQGTRRLLRLRQNFSLFVLEQYVYQIKRGTIANKNYLIK